ncbi:YdeI/OmpD-associated family protein [Streptomyces xiamenensis]
MTKRQPAERLTVQDARAWRQWLDAHEESSDGVLLVLAKKGHTHPTSLTYAQALEEALCSGWIDGRRNAIDERTFQQHFTPRRAASLWSRRNVGIVAALIEEGRMRARGHREIERAKTDGRWERAYDGQALAQVPDDLARALARSPEAAARFAALDRAGRYAVIHRVVTAPGPAGRAHRIERFLTRPEPAPPATSDDPRRPDAPRR